MIDITELDAREFEGTPVKAIPIPQRFRIVRKGDTYLVQEYRDVKRTWWDRLRGRTPLSPRWQTLSCANVHGMPYTFYTDIVTEGRRFDTLSMAAGYVRGLMDQLNFTETEPVTVCTGAECEWSVCAGLKDNGR